uniref:Uncharacterized protein n=1 Tax=Cannabis sativa TaxID=3483 RepID=A0A803Q8I7_CANSA
MRPSFTVALLLILSLTLSEQAQGIRLGKWDFMSSLLGANKEEHKPIIDHEKEIITSSSNKAVKNNDKDEEGNNIMCKDGECSGNSRKLFSTTTVTTPPSSTSTTTSKTTITTSDIDDDQHPDQYEPYSEAVDLAEMDYSPARRKTPIHN